MNINSALNPTAFPSPMPSAKPPSKLWNGIVAGGLFLYEIVAKVALYVLLGIGAHFVIPPIAPPFFAISAATAATRLVVKLLDLYDFNWLNNVKGAVWRFTQKYSMIQLISFVFSVAISFLSGIAGCVVASALGIVNGLLLGVEIVHQEQRIQIEAPVVSNPMREELFNT